MKSLIKEKTLAKVRDHNLHSVNYLAPDWFDETHADKLFKKLESRFRFNSIKVNIKEASISISFSFGATSPKERITEYVSGFLDAID